MEGEKDAYSHSDDDVDSDDISEEDFDNDDNVDSDDISEDDVDNDDDVEQPWQ